MRTVHYAAARINAVGPICGARARIRDWTRFPGAVTCRGCAARLPWWLAEAPPGSVEGGFFPVDAERQRSSPDA